MSFKKDLEFGKKWEEVAKAFVSQTETLLDSAPNCEFKPWDFRSSVASYEVKSDRLAYKYGCKTMFIEFECSGKPSGIQATEADFWMYYMVKPSGECVAYRIPVPELKKMCVGCVSKAGGDGYRSRGYIVPVDERFLIQNLTEHSSLQEQTPKSQCQLFAPQVELKSPLRIVLSEKILALGNTTPEVQEEGLDCPLLPRLLPTSPRCS
jgi:hypothetical protein